MLLYAIEKGDVDGFFTDDGSLDRWLIRPSLLPD